MVRPGSSIEAPAGDVDLTGRVICRGVAEGSALGLPERLGPLIAGFHTLVVRPELAGVRDLPRRSLPQ